MRFFATAIPGIGPVLREELAEAGASPQGDVEFDGRNDVVAFATTGTFALGALRTSEDVFVEIGTGRETRSARTLAQHLWHPHAVERALSVYGANVKPLRTRMTYRVVARVLTERGFTRTKLRDEMAWHVVRERPAWRTADVGGLELWVLETKPERFRLGIRVTTSSMRQRAGRAHERAGALRPTVAATMIRLAGASGSVVDPACGSGTIVAEASAAGARATGSDIDPEAVALAHANVPDAPFACADARALPYGDGSAGAVVSNLPFGERFQIEGDARAWFDAVLREYARVAREAVVLLVPATDAFERALKERTEVKLDRRLDVRLLGMPTTLWVLRRH